MSTPTAPTSTPTVPLPTRVLTTKPTAPVTPTLARPVSMSALKLNSKSRLLLLGAPGSGKTVIGCMMPRPIIFDLDNNIEGPVRYLQQNNLLTNADMENIIIVRPFLDADGNLLRRADRWQALGRAITFYLKEYPDCQTIFLDSFTALLTAAKDEVRRQEKLYIAEGELGDDKMAQKSIDDVLRIQDWGSFATLLEQFLIRLTAKNKFVCVTGHIKDEEVGKDTGVVKTYINCPGETREKIAGSFDECWLISRDVTGLGASAVSNVLITTAAGGSKSPLGLKSAKQVGAQVKVNLATVRGWFQ